MSLTIEAPAKPESAAPQAARGGAVRGGWSLWTRVAAAVLLVGVSGGARWWQSSRVSLSLASGRVSPFPLKEVPMRLGTWTGVDEKLDSDIARATGATDRIFRVYTDRATGVKISVIVLYGPATDVWLHTPERCYPASGYTQADGPMPRIIRSGDKDVPFNALYYIKGQEGFIERQYVYYTWRYNDRWTPSMLLTKKIERIPGMMKVHVARLSNENERLEDHDPCQDFLEVLMPDLDRRLAAAARSNARAGGSS